MNILIYLISTLFIYNYTSIYLRSRSYSTQLRLFAITIPMWVVLLELFWHLHSLFIMMQRQL